MVPWPPTDDDAARAKAVYDEWMTIEEVTKTAAYGMLAQADFESDFDPNAKGDYLDAHGHRMPWSAHPTGTPSSFGMYQRQKPRLNIILARTGVDLYSAVMAGTNTVHQDVASTYWELITFPLYGWDKILAANTPLLAGIAACTYFERASTSAPARGHRAEGWSVYALENGW